jgi:hypothetical protein
MIPAVAFMLERCMVPRLIMSAMAINQAAPPDRRGVVGWAAVLREREVQNGHAGATLGTCHDQLAEIVEEWVLLRMSRDLSVPPLGTARVQVRRVRR